MSKTYTIVGYKQVTDSDGKQWLEAYTDCGRCIAVAWNLRPGLYEVIIDGPTDNRRYEGPEGSEAHGTYERFKEALTGKTETT